MLHDEFLFPVSLHTHTRLPGTFNLKNNMEVCWKTVIICEHPDTKTAVNTFHVSMSDIYVRKTFYAHEIYRRGYIYYKSGACITELNAKCGPLVPQGCDPCYNPMRILSE